MNHEIIKVESLGIDIRVTTRSEVVCLCGKAIDRLHNLLHGDFVGQELPKEFWLKNRVGGELRTTG